MRNIFRDSTNICERKMAGALGRHEIKVQRARMRKSMTCVNPSSHLSRGAKLPGYEISKVTLF